MMKTAATIAITMATLFVPGHAAGQTPDNLALLKREIQALKRENELLAAKLEAANLKIKNLEAARKSGTEEKPDSSRPDNLAEGTKWKGIVTGKSEKKSAEITVIERGEKTVKLSVAYENGARWTFDCSTDGRSLTIKSTDRPAGFDIGMPVGGTRGTGSVTATKFTLNYTVPPARGKPGWSSRIVAEIEK